MTILITGGAGFIGSHFCKLVKRIQSDAHIVILDALTYAGNLQNLQGVLGNTGVTFVHGSITDAVLLERLFLEYRFDALVNFAAETHVDRSVHGNAADFIDTNVKGVQTLLEVIKKHGIKKMIQVSTDEVYGTLNLESRERFTENSPLRPNSPYAASKASADLLCRAYGESFGLPIIITRCTNNFGSFQFPEKMLPYFITELMSDKKIPLYGDGSHVRDWIHVDDHCVALWKVLEQGKVGEIYNIGVGNEHSNKEVALAIVTVMGVGENRVRYVADRPGHDTRYALDASKLFKECGFIPQWPRARFEEALSETIAWYRANEPWVAVVRESVGGIFNPHIPTEVKAKILIVGNGFLGSQYAEFFAQNGYEVSTVSRDQMDVADYTSALQTITTIGPDIVLNASGKTDIDWCEKNMHSAMAVNTIGADNVANVCEKNGIYLVHISSGCVQESVNANDVHREDDAVSPVCFYSWTKVFAEQLISHRTTHGELQALILRPRQLLSAKLTPRNALAKMLSYTQFIDTDNSCTIVPDLLSATLTLIEKHATGIINVVNSGVTSPYKIALQLKKLIAGDMECRIISKKELNEMTLAERIDSVLSCEKLETYGVVLPSISERVQDIIIEFKRGLMSPEGEIMMRIIRGETKAKLGLKQTLQKADVVLTTS